MPRNIGIFESRAASNNHTDRLTDRFQPYATVLYKDIQRIQLFQDIIKNFRFDDDNKINNAYSHKIEDLDTFIQ